MKVRELYEQPSGEIRTPKLGDIMENRPMDGGRYLIATTSGGIQLIRMDGRLFPLGVPQRFASVGGMISRDDWNKISGYHPFVFADTGLPPVWEAPPALPPLRVGDRVTTGEWEAIVTINEEQKKIGVVSLNTGRAYSGQVDWGGPAGHTYNLTLDQCRLLGISNWEVGQRRRD